MAAVSRVVAAVADAAQNPNSESARVGGDGATVGVVMRRQCTRRRAPRTVSPRYGQYVYSNVIMQDDGPMKKGLQPLERTANEFTPSN